MRRVERARGGAGAGEETPTLPQRVADLTTRAREGVHRSAGFPRALREGMTWCISTCEQSVAYSDRPHEGRGPTGFGVRLLLEC